MRSLFLIFFLLGLFAFSFSLQAQDSGDTSLRTDVLTEDASREVAPAKQDLNATEKKPDKVSPSNERVDISKASDEQIYEAQKFYKACTKNEDLNEAHDCRCLAGEYLVARMTLGDKETSRKVFSRVKALCLKGPNDEGGFLDERAAGTDEYTDEQIKEAQGVYDICREHSVMKVKHDCRCFASEYIRVRKEKGRLAGQQEIFVTLRSKCYNGTAVAGHIYSDCISNPEMLPPLVKRAKDFCECYANEYAKAFENTKTEMSMADTQNLGLILMGNCQNEQRELSLN